MRATRSGRGAAAPGRLAHGAGRRPYYNPGHSAKREGAAIDVHLGFEVGTGDPVSVPVKHLAVTGQTQESGKTTALEALVARSGLRAVSFVTKRGEGSFAGGRRLPPYFRERADWQFVESVLESAMRQKMRFERAWIVRASKGAHTLAEVQTNVRKLMGPARGLSADVYMLLNEYLDVVVPLVGRLPPSDRVSLAPGLNVMDLSPYPSQMQGLVIRSVLEWVYEHERDVVTVIPEAWEFVPQGRGSPVKLAAAQLVRKGAALRNYVWLDSQDLAGVDKEVLKQVAVWLVGVQREHNEVRRALAHIPAGVKKPRAEDVATLGRGQFWACWQARAVKVYVQPAWLTDVQARAVALGAVPAAMARAIKGPRQAEGESEDDMAKEDVDAIRGDIRELAAAIRGMVASGPVPAAPAGNHQPTALLTDDEAALYERIKARLVEEAPALLKVLAQRPELRVEVTRPVIELDGSTLRGRLARLLADGWFAMVKTGNAAYEEMKRRGVSTAKPNVYRELDKLTELGFLRKEAAGYQAVPGMGVNVVEK